MNIEWIQSPNCRKPATREISAVIIHYTASLNIAGTIAWFRDRRSGVSAHYVIGRDGRIVQMVKDAHVAWHAGVSELDGRSGVNAFSIGIELVGTQDSGFTTTQLNALYRLLETIVVPHAIPPDRVVGHHDIAPTRKIDPDGIANQFPWAACRWVVRNALTKAGLAWQTTTQKSRPASRSTGRLQVLSLISQHPSTKRFRGSNRARPGRSSPS